MNRLKGIFAKIGYPVIGAIVDGYYVIRRSFSSLRCLLAVLLILSIIAVGAVFLLGLLVR